MTADLNTSGMVDATALIPVGTPVNVHAGPHKGKRGRVRSASGDAHILLNAPGERQPIRVHVDHVTPARTVSKDTDAAIRGMARRR